MRADSFGDEDSDQEEDEDGPETIRDDQAIILKKEHVIFIMKTMLISSLFR